METYNKINDFKHQNHNYETRRIIFEGSNVYQKPCLMGGPACYLLIFQCLKIFLKGMKTNLSKYNQTH